MLEILAASWSILRAAARVGWLLPRSSLPELVSRLRATGGPGTAPDPDLVLRILEPLLPFLPPYGVGRCVKRSLLLLDLWSRAGLEPCFHLGVRDLPGRRGGHAWVTTGATARRTFHPPDAVEAFRA